MRSNVLKHCIGVIENQLILKSKNVYTLCIQKGITFSIILVPIGIIMYTTIKFNS